MRGVLFAFMIILMAAFLIWFFFGSKEKTKTVTLICDLALVLLSVAVIGTAVWARSEKKEELQAQQAIEEEERRQQEEQERRRQEEEALRREEEAEKKAEEAEKARQEAETADTLSGNDTGAEEDNTLSGNDEGAEPADGPEAETPEDGEND